MSCVHILSVGPGAADLIAPRALRLLDEAQAVFCAERYSEMVPEGKRRPLMPLAAATGEIERLMAGGVNTAVLVSGDAGLYSLLETLARRIGRENISVVPGISSLSAFCARLGVSWQNAGIISAHGRALSEAALCHYARTNEKLLLLLDAEHDPNWIRSALDRGGLGSLRLTVGERISYPDEWTGAYQERPYDPLSVALIENEMPEHGLPGIGIEDECFIRGKTPMTKKEIRVQVLSELRLTPDAVVWDIGAGTGSVSIECARQCPLGSVYAIERDETALELIKQNADAFRTLNVVPVFGNAPEALRDLPRPTHVFVGGSSGAAEQIFEILDNFDAPVRVCATAVTLESEQELMRLMIRLEGFTAAQIAVSRIEKLGAYHMRRANNPVSIFAADTGGKS